MKRALLALVLVLSCVTLYSQEKTDTIAVEKVGGGYKFLYKDVTLNLTQLSDAVKSNPLANSEMSKAKTANVFGSILAYTGGYMIGYPVGTMLGGGQMNWAMFGIGTGLAILTIPISNAINKHLNAAVSAFNANPNGLSMSTKKELKLDMADSGIGLKMTF